MLVAWSRAKTSILGVGKIKHKWNKYRSTTLIRKGMCSCHWDCGGCVRDNDTSDNYKPYSCVVWIVYIHLFIVLAFSASTDGTKKVQYFFKAIVVRLIKVYPVCAVHDPGITSNPLLIRLNEHITRIKLNSRRSYCEFLELESRRYPPKKVSKHGGEFVDRLPQF